MVFIDSMVKARVWLALSLFLLFSLSFIIGCSPKPYPQITAFGQTMGTTYSVKLALHEGEPAISSEQLKTLADEEFLRVNQQMSTYIPDSELSLWNRDSSADWVSLSESLAQVLTQSQDISERSAGYFDVTVMPLVNLWGFGPQKQEAAPSDDAIEQAMAHVGYRQVQLEPKALRARKPAEVTVDLSSIAKGFGADQLAERLHSEGYRNFMVEVGGELFLAGANAQGKAWRIGVEMPNYDLLAQREEQPAAAVAVSNVGMATSGDYRNYYELDGVRVSHTIDPHTGHPITHSLASVTVIAPSCAAADGWATALNVMGPEKALEVAQREGLAVYLLVKQEGSFTVKMSAAFESYLDP